MSGSGEAGEVSHLANPNQIRNVGGIVATVPLMLPLHKILFLYPGVQRKIMLSRANRTLASLCWYISGCQQPHRDHYNYDMLDPPQGCDYISSPQSIEALASVQQDVRSGVLTPTLKPLNFVDGENAHLGTSHEY